VKGGNGEAIALNVFSAAIIPLVPTNKTAKTSAKITVNRFIRISIQIDCRLQKPSNFSLRA
jgi:hypothetical protein